MRERIYNQAIEDHFEEDRQMLFLMGPRQVGKTTASLLSNREGEDLYYFNWDDPDHRKILMQGPAAVVEASQLHSMPDKKPVLAFDEIHKAPNWKLFLKGFFDSYGSLAHILVTGSARLDVYQKGGDSLMGRYFRYRLHPFSVAELIDPTLPEKEIRKPRNLLDEDWARLWEFGGFPEPFTKAKERFFSRWSQLRHTQVIREDLRDLTRVQEMAQLELLAELLRQQAGSLSSFASFAKHVRVAIPTIQRWIELLNSVYYCYLIRPWTRNVSRSLLKEPKVYLYDWSQVDDEGARFENMIAAHLLKAVHFWTDYGFGQFGLHYLRTKDKREVDFLVTRNQQPWFLVEAKVSDGRNLSPHLQYFKEKTGAPHAFQVVRDFDYVDADCFSQNRPVIVPARTFLSQLV